MNDLKATGQESVETLIATINNFESKELRLNNEIRSLTSVVDKKLMHSQEKIDKINYYKKFIETESGMQESKIKNLNEKIGDKKQNILELKRQIVLLEAK